MKNIIVKPDSPLHWLFPLVQKSRQWCWKYHDRMGIRLVISGGRIRFMDAELIFPERVGLAYSTPLFWNGPDAYEAPTSRAISALVGKSKLFLDIGSNIGIYSVYAGVKFPKVKTFAFEPIPVIFEKNRAFHRANKLSDEVVLNVAVGDQEGSQTIFIPVYTTGLEEEQTATLCADSWQTKEEKVESIQVQCLTLDSFAAKSAFPDGRCTLKIDVENFEAGVLRGGKRFIGERRPWIVCEILPDQEIDPVTKVRRNNNHEVLALVKELNYVPYAITGDGFFRMSLEDFDRPRTIKDFLLAPKEAVSADMSYFTVTSLEELLAAAF